MISIYEAVAIKCDYTKKKITFLVVSDNMHDAQKLVKNHLKETMFRFLSVMPSNKTVLIDPKIKWHLL